MDICDHNVFLQTLSEMGPGYSLDFTDWRLIQEQERLLTRNRKFPHHTYLRFLHAWQLSCGLSRRLEDGGRDFSALFAPVIGPTLGDCARCFGKVIVRAVFRPKTADYRCSMDDLANNFTC